MEHGACNVIYVDRRATDEHVRRESLSKSLVACTSTSTVSHGYFASSKPPPVEVHANVETILSTFNQVHICTSGNSCLDKITQLLESTKENIPIILLIDIPYDEEQRLKRLSREPRTPSPTTARIARADTVEPDDIYGTHLLMHVSSEIQTRNFSKLVIPIVVLSGINRDRPSSNQPSAPLHGSQVLTDTVRLVRYLDAGAVDVLSSPLSKDNVHGLAVHAYRIHKEVSREEAAFLTTKRNRKLSWVGMSDAKPYAYLREAMVSSLMSGICNPENVGDCLDATDLFVPPERKKAVAKAIGSWSFSAHDFTDDELLYGALLMLQHALKVPELEEWGLSEAQLTIFLLASRTAYNEFVLYHNFRHVTDVLQALFHFLIQIGTLPPYPPRDQQPHNTSRSPIAHLLKPFDALTLLISAIGHDVGHPGVNNAFLVALNAPLAQLYNDRSVLESFHCAAYSQILRRYWPRAFADIAMRKLMINSILATDMGLHFKYMTDLGNLQQKIAHVKGVTDGWSVKIGEENRDLACGLLIKCADISNVARKFECAAKWANILTDEFSNQGVMEEELQIPSCLFGGPPVRDDIIKLGESQIGFMNIFARPLFEAVADILPGMQFAVDEILTNKSTWGKIIEEARTSRSKRHPNLVLGPMTPRFAVDPMLSPFSGGPSFKLPVDALAQSRAIHNPNKIVQAENAARRGSSGSINAVLSASRRSSLGIEKGSRRSSATGVAAVRSLDNQTSSRRGSADASITAILITQSPNAAEKSITEETRGPVARSDLPSERKDTLVKTSPVKTFSRLSEDPDHSARPLTAPSPRRSPNHNLVPLPHSVSQRRSDFDLSQTANGSSDDSKTLEREFTKMSTDSNGATSDASREGHRKSDWWRPMGGRRRTRDVRNGDPDVHVSHKDSSMLDTPHSTTDYSTPTSNSPGRNSRTEKLKSFFKRKPKSDEQEKQLSSRGSSSHLRSPPTSDQGQSISSDTWRTTT